MEYIHLSLSFDCVGGNGGKGAFKSMIRGYVNVPGGLESFNICFRYF